VCLRDIHFTGVESDASNAQSVTGIVKLKWTERSSVVGSLEGLPLMHESSSFATLSTTSTSSSTTKRAQQWPKDILHLVSARGQLQSWLKNGDNSASANGVSSGLKLFQSILSILSMKRKADDGGIRDEEGASTERLNNDSDKMNIDSKETGLSRVKSLREDWA